MTLAVGSKLQYINLALIFCCVADADTDTFLFLYTNSLRLKFDFEFDWDSYNAQQWNKFAHDYGWCLFFFIWVCWFVQDERIQVNYKNGEIFVQCRWHFSDFYRVADGDATDSV